ncbi:hypothetical protein ABEX25_26070 [Paenibacillus thiaminolyticus]|uniref:hypothetical protein n=1 Tax=Paenibacillus thiaminolyticus TaxID=49283 RepID=UPI003D2C2B9C
MVPLKVAILAASQLQGKGSAQYSLWEEAEDLTAIRTMFEENAQPVRLISCASIAGVQP